MICIILYDINMKAHDQENLCGIEHWTLISIISQKPTMDLNRIHHEIHPKCSNGFENHEFF